MENENDKCRDFRRGVIITPAAIGDCLLMLPLARYMKDTLSLGAIDMIGHHDYVGFYPGRTCINNVRSIESIDFHRLFVDSKSFSPEKDDPVINALSSYEWIVSFMGAGHDDFESNLIYAINCVRSAEVTFVEVIAEKDFPGHISEYYIKQFMEANPYVSENTKVSCEMPTVLPGERDIETGNELLKANGLDPAGKIVVIHPGSGGKEKCWHLENFCDLGTSLQENEVQVLFVLGPAEEERFDEKAKLAISSAGKCVSGLGLEDIMRIVARADCFVGNDSGITHLASAVGTDTLAVFGNTNSTMYRPLGQAGRVFAAKAESFGARDDGEIRGAMEVLRKILDV